MVFLPPYIQFLLFFHFNELKMLSNDLDGCLPSLHECVLSHVQLSATPWIIAHQAPLSTGFSRQEYWGGLLFPPPGHLPNPGMHSMSVVAPALKADSLPLSHHFPSRDDSLPLFSFTVTVSAMRLIPHV